MNALNQNTTVSTAQVDFANSKNHPSELGAWIFIFADMCIFAMYFGVYLWEKSLSPAMFSQGQATLNTGVGGFNTLVLLLSSYFVAKAVHQARLAQLKPFKLGLKLTIFCGLIFLCVKFVEYREKLSAGINLTTNEFYQYYFAFTGFHMLHVILGISFLAWLLFSIKTTDQLNYKTQTVESVGLYWHMVDLLWVVLFALIYLAP